MGRWWGRTIVGGLAALCLCAAGPAPQSLAPPLAEVETTLLLIGDAGAAGSRDPVLKALAAQVAQAPSRTVTVFLGDNIYPNGLPAKGARGRREAERRLNVQVEAAVMGGGRVLFVPGNHDWELWGPGGWDAVRRQGEFLRQKGPTVALLPPDGCPGPVVQDVDSRLRLILLDTQWWLHPYTKPKHPTSPCPQDSEAEVADALLEALQGAGDRRVVVAGHHPLASGGIHGGYFGLRDHLFPLRASKSWLWIPLPGIGSVYPYARRRGVTDQDLSGKLNVKMREALEGVFDKKEPLVYAAGHEHNLQVLKGKNVKYLLVSGTGYFGHVARVVSTEATLFARPASGFMRLDFAREGDVRLSVLTVDGTGRATEAFAQLIK